ncbi:MAG: sensor histidine kinase [Syntrophobacteraceae bacterium]
MRNISNSLAFRLLCLLLLISALVFAALTTFILRAQRGRLIEEAIATNELLLRSMRQSMLLNRQSDVAKTIEALGSGPGIYGIRIFDKNGRIVFSAKKGEIGRQVPLSAKECIVCHRGKKQVENIRGVDRTRTFVSSQGRHILGVFEPIRNEAACSATGCHPPPARLKILGMLDSQFDLGGAAGTISRSLKLMMLYSLGAILLIELFAGLFIIRNVTRRLRKLAEGPREIKKGNLDFRIELEGQDEIAAMAHSFNSMVVSLKQAEAENRELSRRVIHNAKMASMGRLAASVAHEINNPLSGVLTYTKLISRKISEAPLRQESKEEMLKQFEACISEIKRCGNIVRNLLQFSRDSEASPEKVDIHTIINKSLSITNHHFEINNIATIARLQAGDPTLLGDANQLEQVLIALFMNAVEAMPAGGVLSITTSETEGGAALLVRVADTGRGIPPQILSSIFEPFFTTKEGEHSAGMGLSVVYGIMLRHRGQIEVESEPGKGAVFLLTFPRQKAPENDN